MPTDSTGRSIPVVGEEFDEADYAEGSSGAGRAEAAVGSVMESARPPVWSQGIVVSIAGAVFLLILAILAVRTDAEITGVPATETTGPLFWGLAVLFTAIVGIGAQYSEFAAHRAAEMLGQRRPDADGNPPSAWIVPVVSMAAAALLVATLHNTLMFIVGPAFAFFAIGGSLLARDLLEDATEPTWRTATIVHTVVLLVVAFVAFSAVYLNKMTLWVTVPLVAIFGGLLLFEALERGRMQLSRRVVWSVVGAFIMAEVMLILDWWLTYGWTGGGVLLVAFYLLSGMMLVWGSRGMVRRRELYEVGIVSLLAMVILVLTA